MTGKTTMLINEIKRKVKNSLTKEPEFKTTDQIVEAAVIDYYNRLKREKFL